MRARLALRCLRMLLLIAQQLQLALNVSSLVRTLRSLASAKESLSNPRFCCRPGQAQGRQIIAAKPTSLRGGNTFYKTPTFTSLLFIQYLLLLYRYLQVCRWLLQLCLSPRAGPHHSSRRKAAMLMGGATWRESQ